MAGPNTPVSQSTGTTDFGGGVNSVKVSTIASENNPNGLARNESAWLINAAVRDGGVFPRAGWERLGEVLSDVQLLGVTFQGGFLYEPLGGFPYLIISVGGQIYRVDIAGGIVVANLSALFGLSNPATEPTTFYCQAEQFLVIQAGDGVTLPLFWDGTTLRRSIGITNTAVAPGTPGINEIPAATCMDYYMGRLWYAQGRTYSAGDIVGGPSGTIAYAFTDAVLNVTENPLVVGGDGFNVPTTAGNIRALKHNANLDAALGQGQLFVFTRKAIYALQVPVTRTDWINASTENGPLQTVVQIANGSVNDKSVIAVNGDLFYQSFEPGIRSLISAVRYFNQWGNKSISANENRVLQFVDRALLYAASGITFNNRLLMTTLPSMTPVGVAHQALIPLDFIPISNFGAESSPVWEGIYEGLDHLQLFVGDFGGLDRAFSLVYDAETVAIELWELSQASRFDSNVGGESRVTMVIETPAFTWASEFALKKLVAGELWMDRLFGEAIVTVEWRPDGDACWYTWTMFKICTARNCEEDVFNPCGASPYPTGVFGESFRSTLTLPQPPQNCASVSGRPAHIGYQHQLRLTIKGSVRLRGIVLHAEGVERKLYANMVNSLVQ